MQVLAPATPFSLWLHGVGHDEQWRCGAAPAVPPHPYSAGPGCGRAAAQAGSRARFAGVAAMTGGDPGPLAAAGAPARHIPVLLREVIANLAPQDGGEYSGGEHD